LSDDKSKLSYKMIPTYGAIKSSITDWNQLLEGAMGTPHIRKHFFKTRVRKLKISEWKWRR